MADVPRELRETLTMVGERMTDLMTEIKELNDSQMKIQESSSRHRILITCLIIGFLIGTTVFAYRTTTNQQRIEEQQVRVQEIQARTSNEVLCPLYGIFITAIDNPSPEQKARQERDPNAKKAAEDAKRVILEGYATLGCRPTR